MSAPYDVAHRMLTDAGITADAAESLLRDVPADGLATLATISGRFSDPVAYLAALDVRTLAELLCVTNAVRFAQTCRQVRS